MFLCLPVPAQTGTDEKPARKQLAVPPLSNGGIAGLWTPEHLFIESQFGPFELLSFENTEHRIKRDSITDKTWQLVAMGNYLRKGLQFATLARLKDRPDGTLLFFFEWKDAADSANVHGVFYHTFLSKDDLLIRTTQGTGGTMDTLEVSCADIQRVCGKVYYDQELKRMKLHMVGAIED